uniref:Xyloglucan endotransglucosylase/hydrolase n=1 Tax=Oryza punctata TaxID=4537 RepID=A0A0E0KUT8_ORYPU
MAPLPLASSSKLCSLLLLVLGLVFLAAVDRSAAGIFDEIELIWGASRTYFFMDGDSEALALSLDQSQGSCFRSREKYLYVQIDVEIKLIEGDSAGTVCTIYTISEGPWEIHDEIDLEFLGNVTGEPYTLHTNIFANGIGGREQQFRLWFDPTADYHTYSIVWNPKHILILVDGKAIRDFKNNEDQGVPFPTWQSMRTFGSLWSAEDWATQGGRVKTDWTQAPFVTYYRNYNVTWCRPSPGVAWCGDEPKDSTHFDLDAKTLSDLQWVRSNYMIYNYCDDNVRFNATTRPKECTLQ